VKRRPTAGVRRPLMLGLPDSGCPARPERVGRFSDAQWFWPPESHPRIRWQVLSHGPSPLSIRAARITILRWPCLASRALEAHRCRKVSGFAVCVGIAGPAGFKPCASAGLDAWLPGSRHPGPTYRSKQVEAALRRAARQGLFRPPWTKAAASFRSGSASPPQSGDSWPDRATLGLLATLV